MASDHYGISRFTVLQRYLRLRARGFSEKELALWDLLSPSLTSGELNEFVSKNEFLAYQAKTSPVGHAALLEDKEVFYRYAQGHGIPVPTLFGFVSRDGIRAAATSDLLLPDDLMQSLVESKCGGVVLKPSNGVYGRGFQRFSVQNNSLIARDGSATTLDDLLRSLPPTQRFVLQARVANHPSIQELTDTETLQTVRIVTATSKNPIADATVLSAAWRTVGKNTETDNFDYGRDGNIRARVELNSGCIAKAIRASGAGFGIESVMNHPTTGHPLVGFQLPVWEETLSLMRALGRLFYPIRLVGWDVALTSRGPVVIEGNYWFDPDNAWRSHRDLIKRFETL